MNTTLMVEEEVSVNFNADSVAMFATPEKSVDELLKEAVDSRQREREQYAQLLFRLGKKRAELTTELEKVQSQFRGVELLLQRADETVSLLAGEQKKEPVVRDQQASPRLVLNTKTDPLGEKLKEKFGAVGRAISVKEMAEELGVPTYTITNYVAGKNKLTQVLKLVETGTRAKFFKI